MTLRTPVLALGIAAATLTLAACNKSGGDSSAKGGSASAAGAVAPPAGQAWTDVVAQTPEGGFRMGNPNAAIKLVEYGSRTCPHCAKFDEEGLPQLKKYVASGKVSYEFRDYPVHGALDVPAVLLGGCGGPDKFFPLLDQMMRNQNSFLDKASTLDQAKLNALQDQPGKLATALADGLGYIDFVKQRGISEDQARACLSDKAALDRFAKSTQEATKQYNITGTPTFILNGNVVPNAAEWPAVEDALKAAGA